MKRDTGKELHRVIAFLSREQIDFLDRIGKDALFETGSKLSRTKLISGLVDTARKLNLNGHGVKSIEELNRCMIESACEELMKLKKGEQGKVEVTSAKPT